MGRDGMGRQPRAHRGAPRSFSSQACGWQQSPAAISLRESAHGGSARDPRACDRLRAERGRGLRHAGRLRCHQLLRRLHGRLRSPTRWQAWRWCWAARSRGWSVARRSVGLLAMLAGLAWFGPDWEGWAGASPLVRSLGAVAAVFFLPLLLHLSLALPAGGLGAGRPGWASRPYALAAGVALGRALFRDPFLDPYCWRTCLDNAFLVHAGSRARRLVRRRLGQGGRRHRRRVAGNRRATADPRQPGCAARPAAHARAADARRRGRGGLCGRPSANAPRGPRRHRVRGHLPRPLALGVHAGARPGVDDPERSPSAWLGVPARGRARRGTPAGGLREGLAAALGDPDSRSITGCRAPSGS